MRKCSCCRCRHWENRVRSPNVHLVDAVIRNCLIPLTKAHPKPDTPNFSAVDVKAVAEFLVDHVVQFFNLFQFVLREDRAQETTHVENVIDIPYTLPLDTALPGTYLASRRKHCLASERALVDVHATNMTLRMQKTFGMNSCSRKLQTNSKLNKLLRHRPWPKQKRQNRPDWNKRPQMCVSRPVIMIVGMQSHLASGYAALVDLRPATNWRTFCMPAVARNQHGCRGDHQHRKCAPREISAGTVQEETGVGAET